MKKSMPRIGMRIIKTSIAAFLILLIFTAVGAKRSPFYVLITTIICIQPDIANTKDTAFNRAIGTLIGAVTGAVAMLLEMPLKGLPGGDDLHYHLSDGAARQTVHCVHGVRGVFKRCGHRT